MKAKFFLTMFFVFVGMAGLSAENLVLEYSDGTVEAKSADNSWKLLDVGATVATDAVLRLSDNGVAELSSSTAKLHLSKDGTYQVAKLLVQAKQKPSSSVAGLSGTQISALLGGGSSSGVSVANMGARGAAQGDDGSMTWAQDDAAAPVADDVEAKIKAEDWPGALSSVDSALAAGSADSKTLLFDKALILARMGRAAGSLKALSEANFQPGQPRYIEAVLLTGSQGLETQDYDLVLTSSGQALQTKPETTVVQNLKLTQALAWRGKGDETKAKGLLNDVVDLGPKTSLGTEASRLLAQ
jgi:hypothetical protein